MNGLGTPRTSLSPELLNAVERALGAAGAHPLALVGPTSCGKTTLLRRVFGASAVEPLLTTARDLVEEMVGAIRGGHFARWREAFARDLRPLVVEHLEDLHGKPLAMLEVQRLERASPILLTLTLSRHSDDVVAWLSTFAQVVRLSRS